MKLTENAMQLLSKRYLIKDEQGNVIETPDELFRRVAHAVAISEQPELVSEWEEKFYDEMVNLRFLPNSPTLMNAGRELGQMAACFLIDVEDSMEGIFDAVKNVALIQKSGGGTGMSFSGLRPRNDFVKSTSGISSGPVSFMKVFNAATEAVKQGGKRRGANIGLLSVDHPDIMEFIEAKSNQDELNNFNISVAITDAFMLALYENKEYDLINPRTGRVVSGISASKVFDRICELAWRYGDPGVIFIDRINDYNPTPKIGRITGTNPCWAGDTKIWTIKGHKEIKDLVGGEVPVLTKLNDGTIVFRMMRNIQKTGENASVLEIDIKNVHSEISTIRCTPNHRLILSDGTKVEAKDIKIGDSMYSVYRHRANSKGYLRLYGSDDAPMEHHSANHKVTAIGKSNSREDVYNGTVDETHTYFVVAGENDAILSSNCAEMPLLSYESCVLGSVNLPKFIKDGKFDYEKLKKTVQRAVRFLDNVVDINGYPLPIIEERTKANRKIGLGVMGFADTLIELGIPYGSDESLDLASEIMSKIDKYATNESCKLGDFRGPFPNHKESIYAPSTKIRNATRTTIAPTGSIAIIAGCSSGIEPLFGIAFKRNLEESLGTDLIEVNEKFEEIAKARGFYSEELMKKIATTLSIQEFDEIPSDVKALFKTAHDVTPAEHINIQAAFQEFTDNGVSKTVNCGNGTTIEEVKEIFKLAFERGCKGITIYRDGSRDIQLLDRAEKAPIIRGRDSRTTGYTERVRLGCNRNLYVTLNEDSKGPCEAFIQVGKSGGCITSNMEAIGRLISLALRGGISLDKIAEQLAGIRCPSPVWAEGKPILSCADAIANALSEKRVRDSAMSPECPECGSMLEFTEGCELCRSCGYSKCA